MLTLLVFGAAVYLVVSGVQVYEASQLGSGASNVPVVSALVVSSTSSTAGVLDQSALARLEEVQSLYAARRAPRVVIASTKGESRLGDLAANWLVRNGVERSALTEVRCDSSANCFESIDAALGSRASIVVVTEAIRASWVEHAAESAGLETRVAPSKDSVPGTFPQFSPVFRQASALGVGRIIGFGRVPWAGL